jgi:hypothetical protein
LPGFYISDATNYICDECNKTCSQCIDNKNLCTECKTSYLLNEIDATTASCLKGCLPNRYFNTTENKCIACHASC